MPSDPQITCRLAPVEDPIKFSSTSSGQSFGHEDESADLPDPTCFFNFFFFITFVRSTHGPGCDIWIPFVQVAFRSSHILSYDTPSFPQTFSDASCPINAAN